MDAEHEMDELKKKMRTYAEYCNIELKEAEKVDDLLRDATRHAKESLSWTPNSSYQNLAVSVALLIRAVHQQNKVIEETLAKLKKL